MGRRIALQLSQEAADRFDRLLSEANQEFEVGRVLASDLLNEIILSTKVDLRALQVKHLDLRRSLKVLSSKEGLDIESAIRFLTDMRSPLVPKKKTRSADAEGGHA